MVTRYKLFASLLLAAVLGGCTSITPAGPAVYVRNQNGLYPVSFTWETNQRSLRADSTRQYEVILGGWSAYLSIQELGVLTQRLIYYKPDLIVTFDGAAEPIRRWLARSAMSRATPNWWRTSARSP